MRPFLLLIPLVIIISACPNLDEVDYATEANSVLVEESYKLFQEERLIHYALHNDTVVFKFHESAKSDIYYFNMHDDENTTVGAIISILDCNFNGEFFELKHNGKRLVEFNFNKKKYTFDPNRIFTSAGVKSTLGKYGNYDKKAAEIVEGFGEFIVDSLLKDAKVVVALHNNSDNNYSIKNYLPGKKYESDASEVFLAEGKDADDFFYVTERSFFEKLKEQNYNVLLQNNKNVTDDGSLSVYCGQNGIKYINIEAQEGHLDVNKEMITLIDDILSEEI